MLLRAVCESRVVCLVCGFFFFFFVFFLLVLFCFVFNRERDVRDGEHCAESGQQPNRLYSLTLKKCQGLLLSLVFRLSNTRNAVISSADQCDVRIVLAGISNRENNGHVLPTAAHLVQVKCTTTICIFLYHTIRTTARFSNNFNFAR